MLTVDSTLPDISALLGQQLPIRSSSVLSETFFDDNSRCKYYTGLDTKDYLTHVFTLVSYYLPQDHPECQLTLFQQFTLLLIKLRLNLSNEELSIRFNVSTNEVLRIFRSWLPVFSDEGIFYEEVSTLHLLGYLKVSAPVQYELPVSSVVGGRTSY